MLLKSFILGSALAVQGLTASIADRHENTLMKRTDHYGVATYYDQNNQAGSCGEIHGGEDKIVAIGTSWQGWGYPPTYCGRNIQITNLGGGQDNPGTNNIIVATVKDTCAGCDPEHLDLSQGAFKALTNGHLDPPGKFNIVWHFCDANGQC